jgi:pyruvate/2-oxoacid:ferredoxin oxidoreductase alpha subunit
MENAIQELKQKQESATENQDQALVNSMPVILQAWKEWKDLTGREYKPVESYRMDGAKTVILTMGLATHNGDEERWVTTVVY